jgi:hypothetical protein
MRKAILYFLLDGDFLLCHVASSLPYKTFSAMSGDEVLRLAREETVAMAAEGLISVIQCSDPEFQRNNSVIAPDQAGPILIDESNWSVPDERTTRTFSIEMTPAGDALLRQMMGSHDG